jgi:hypothetical protein
MKAIQTYSTTVEADLAKMTLLAEGIESVVVGVGVSMEGGAGGVALLVAEDRVGAALEVLERAK